jgi:hypothetical protein
VIIVIDMTVKEGNKLIAGFMGFEFNRTDSFGNDNYRLPDMYRKYLHCSHFDNLYFNSSWDWLIPVIEKCTKSSIPQQGSILLFKNQFNFEEYNTKLGLIMQSLLKLNINKTCRCVIEFIQWYNEHRKE